MSRPVTVQPATVTTHLVVKRGDAEVRQHVHPNRSADDVAYFIACSFIALAKEGANR